MAKKKLQGDLNVTGDYLGNGITLLTTADCAYDSTKTYKVGQVCSYGEYKNLFTCIEEATGEWYGTKWITPPIEVGGVDEDGQQFSKYLNLNEAGQLVIELAGATITNDTTTHTIKIVKSGHVFPLGGTPADNPLIALLKGGAIRQIIWPSFAPSAGLMAQVTFDSYFLDLSLVESEDIVSLQCYSPACKMTIVDETGSGGNTTILLHFTDDASSVDGNYSIHSPYEVISQLIALNQYESVILDPVIAYMH